MTCVVESIGFDVAFTVWVTVGVEVSVSILACSVWVKSITPAQRVKNFISSLIKKSSNLRVDK